MVKKQSMDGSGMSDEIDGENMVEIFEGNPKSLQKLFDSDHLQFEKNDKRRIDLFAFEKRFDGWQRDE